MTTDFYVASTLDEVQGDDTTVDGACSDPRTGRDTELRVAVAVACLLGTQFLHWRVTDQHAEEWEAAGIFFFLLALTEGSLAILLITRLRPSVVAAGIVASVVPLTIWAWDRTLGLPLGPTSGSRGTIGRSDAMSVILEILTIVALWPLFRRPRRADRGAGVDQVGRIVIAATCLYVAGLSMWAVLGDQSVGEHVTETTVTVVDNQAPSDNVPLNEGVSLSPTQP